MPRVRKSIYWQWKKKKTKTRRNKYKKRSKTYTKTLWTGPTIPILSLNSR